MNSVFKVIVLLVMFVATPALAQQRSAKRGVCWEEKTQPLTDGPIKKLAPGVSWFYNWGPHVTGTATLVGQGDGRMAFLPMCWNGAFNETYLRTYLTNHPGQVKYLLAYNEPNLSWSVGGAAMTPQQAADAWPKVEKVAADYGLQIVAPALNFTGDVIGDRVWEPFAWYDEFFRLCPDAKIDYLCFHSYMNYYSAVDWVTSEYFYTDKEEGNLMTATNRARYPHLVKFMDDYKTAHGHYPRMFLTEFCAWGTSDYPYTAGLTRDFQIDQMVAKVQKLEQSDLVAGYAWFMGNSGGGYNEFPYMSLLQTNSSSSELSELGKIYTHMSPFDFTKFYAPGETILAKDYVNASLDDQQPRVRSNSESGSDIPLQVEWRSGSWTAYQVSLPADGEYTVTLHMSSTAECPFRIYEDALGAKNKRLDTSLASTSGSWKDVTTPAKLTLTAGHHTLLLYNMGTSSILLNSLTFNSVSSDIRSLRTAATSRDTAFYTLSGRRLTDPTRPGIYVHQGRKVVVK